MSRAITKLLFIIFLILASNGHVFAIDYVSTESAVVSATVVGSTTTTSPPILIAPNNNSTTNNPREPLVWKRPDPLPITPLHHYDVFVDGTLFAASVSDGIVSQSYYYYNIYRVGDTFYLNLNSDLAQGYHTWSVTVYDTLGNSASSETRTFYVDSIIPFIILKKVDYHTLNWSTLDLNTIPNVNQRDLAVTTPNPLLTGSVEPYANMQIILLCPQNILSCSTQTHQGNYPTGNWQHRFYGLIKGLIYTVHLSATDAGGNSVFFPEFYLAYGIVTPTPSAITTPIPTPPGATPTITPETTPEIVVTPTPFITVPPIAPTPPDFQSASLVTPQQKIITWLLILIVIGLPLHLFMTIYGAGIRFTSIISFFFSLLFPFLGKKEFQSVPFATLDMYDPENLNSTWQSKISDVNGFYSLTTPLLNKIYIKINCVGRHWKNIIVNGSILPASCLFPHLDDPKIPSNRLRLFSMRFRSLPLILACITSSIALTIFPNYFFLIYLYLSLQLAFSEYLYPRLQK